jgi:hypothetical protein
VEAGKVGSFRQDRLLAVVATSLTCSEAAVLLARDALRVQLHFRFCDGFRMAAPSLSSQHARWLPGRRSKAASEGNRGRVGTPISGRYGDFAGADCAAEVLEAGVGGKWFGRAGASEGMTGDFVEMAGRLRGRWRAKAAKRTCAVVAGRRQR